MKPLIIRSLFLCFVIIGINPIFAGQIPQEESCRDGYYTGPRDGRKNFSNDKYIWVVTLEFAKRFCMPPEFVDEELKGAEAIAFKMSTRTGLIDRCAIIDGKKECAGDKELRFDIFLRSDLNLPAANPEVKFFDGSWDNAGWHIASGRNNERATRGQRYRKGEYQLPPGKMPHFGNPYVHPDWGNIFGLLGVTKEKKGWPIALLLEWRYEAEWAEGLDLLTLQSNSNGEFNHPRMEALGIDQYVITEDIRKDSRKDSERQVPEDYAHTIWLPKAFYEKVKAAATVGRDPLYYLQQR
ncbi:MAG: hypothetical protein PHQ22_08370 [Sulfuricurvum sp.]|nr:hypothetical protein [Sulfuricurvum sp.]MDD5387191.1 hypothetical protein [Sulfuricurvum sp.]